MPKKSSAPVVLFVYKRPERTRKILTLIVDAGPQAIYIFSDGPQSASDSQDIQDVRAIVEEFIQANPTTTFICSFSPKNLGLRASIESGLHEVFSREKMAIILEDDCIPSPDFFRFMDEMLVKYQDEPKVMSITGSGLPTSKHYSYDFSSYEQCWGWATWQRAWRLYDPSLAKHDKLKFSSSVMTLYWRNILKLVKAGRVESWAFIWSYSHFINSGLAIIPASNLISNVGFDDKATNTTFQSGLSDIPHEEIQFPLKHPPSVTRNPELDRLVERKYYNNPVAILGLIRQYIYYLWNNYANRT